LVLSAAAVPAAAQGGYPAKPIRLLVGFATGGGQDIAARIVARKLTEEWGQSVIVENRAGANGIIAAETAAKAVPDGYTLHVFTINDTINAGMRKLAYDATRDFAAITRLSNVAYVVVVHPSLPVKTLQELIALAKARPGQLTHGSSGSGSGIHLATELFKSMAGIDIVHVPYKGTGPALVDLMGGQIQLYFSTMSSATPHAKTGRIRPLAVTSERRSPIFPQVPTVAEAGLPGCEAGSWNGIVAPARTPDAIVTILNREIVKMIKAPDVMELFSSQGADPGGSTPEEFARFIKSEIEKWSRVVKTVGIRAD
jgi:tripartite-type tricarboxylate transporter receptor subunit TctC